jgi:hypothetical protein
MKITFSKVHYSARFSEETACFDAVVSLDGVPSLEASNHGQGGPTDLHEIVKGSYDKLKAYALTLKDKSKYEPAEYLVDILFEEYLGRKEMVKKLKKYVYGVKNNTIYSYRKALWPNEPFLQKEVIARFKVHSPTLVILNTMSEDEAFALWKKYLISTLFSYED